MTGYMPAQALLLALIKTMPEFQDTYAASTLACDTASHKIIDSSGGLAWVAVSDAITVTGSALNDGTYTVVSKAAGYVVVNEDLVDEAEGAAVTITREPTASEGDARILDSGHDYFCILYPGAVPEYDMESMTRVQVYQATMHLFIRFTGDASYSVLGTLRDSVIAALDGSPCLSADYFMTNLQGAEPEELAAGRDGPTVFVRQIFSIHIEEQV